jgi:hypothetical protein
VALRWLSSRGSKANVRVYKELRAKELRAKELRGRSLNRPSLDSFASNRASGNPERFSLLSPA